MTEDCGRCGTQNFLCNNQCEWKVNGMCQGQGSCKAGTTGSQACGNCGNETRMCSPTCSWGPWSSCANQGSCAPLQTSTAGCGPNMFKTCSGNCQWGACACDLSSIQECGLCVESDRYVIRSGGTCGGFNTQGTTVNCAKICGNELFACFKCPTGYNDKVPPGLSSTCYDSVLGQNGYLHDCTKS
jgi:hypothetical protein